MRGRSRRRKAREGRGGKKKKERKNVDKFRSLSFLFETTQSQKNGKKREENSNSLSSSFLSASQPACEHVRTLPRRLRLEKRESGMQEKKNGERGAKKKKR